MGASPMPVPYALCPMLYEIALIFTLIPLKLHGSTLAHEPSLEQNEPNLRHKVKFPDRLEGRLTVKSSGGK